MIDPIVAVEAVGAQRPVAMSPTANPAPQDSVSFEQLLRSGVETANSRLAEADRMVTAFTLDNDIPAHQVTFALEQARLSLELMVQVRNRIVESYQQIMNMQV